MKELIQKWLELSDKNFVDETLADSMEMDTCAINHRIKGEIYKQCADELEAALKAVELAQLSHNTGSPKCACPWIKPCDFCKNGYCTYSQPNYGGALRAGA